MTLVEIIVALVIATIVIAMAGGILISAMNLISRNTQQHQDIDLAEYLLDYLTGQMEGATGIEAPVAYQSDGYATGYGDVLTAGHGAAVIYIGDVNGAPAASGKGYLWYKPSNTLPGIAPDYGAVNAFGTRFYNNRTVSLDVTFYKGDEVTMLKPPDDVEFPGIVTRSVTIKVCIYGSDGQLMLERSRSFKTLNDKPWYGTAYKDEYDTATMVALSSTDAETGGTAFVLEVYQP
jgi:hypothetical protein